MYFFFVIHFLQTASSSEAASVAWKLENCEIRSHVKRALKRSKKRKHMQIRRQLPIVKMSASKEQWIPAVVSALYEEGGGYGERHRGDIQSI